MAARTLPIWLACAAVISQAAFTQLSQSWIVELNDSKMLMSTTNAIASHLKWRSQIFQITNKYSTDVFTALSLICYSDCEQDIYNIEGVKYVWKPNTYHQRSVEQQPDNLSDSALQPFNISGQGTKTHINHSHSLAQVDLLHNRNLTGKGVRVAIVDGGLDYLHPALGAGFGPGYRIEYGWDFVGDNVKPPNKEQPDDDPYGDCSNHATHTAGILFAEDSRGDTGFRGVAPGVSVEHYRVFDCNGMSTSDVVVRAVLLAYERGIDLINLSLGSGSRPFSDDPLSSLVARINRGGKTFIVVAGGNNGRNGTFTAAAPDGGGDDMFVVGSVDAAYAYSVTRPATLVLDGSPVRNITYNAETWTAHRRSEFPLRAEVVALNHESSVEDEGCETIIDGKQRYKDKIVLMKRGGCTLKSKMENLARAGGIYVLIYNNVAGPAFDLEVRLDNGTEIRGAASVTQQTGEYLLGLLAADHRVEIDMDSNFTRSPVIESVPNVRTAAKVSTFTSWGPSGEGKLVSRVLAPGGGILSTFPRKNGGWGIQSGTSMAVPYVVGVLALLKEAFPTVPTCRIANAVMATAHPLEFNDGTNWSFGFLTSPWQQGAGLINAWGAFGALELGLSTDTTWLGFNDTEFGNPSLTFKLENTGNRSVMYDVFSIPSVSVLALDKTTQAPVPLTAAIRTPEATSEFLNTLLPALHAQTALSTDSVVLAPGDQATITLTVDTTGLESMQDRCPLYGGFIFLSSLSEHRWHNISIPYAGVACKFRDIPTLNKVDTYVSSASRDDVATAHFWNKPLQRIEGDSFQLSRNQEPFDGQNPDHDRFLNERMPVIQVQLNMQTRGIRAELRKATSGAAVSLFADNVGVRTGGWGRIEKVYWVWDGRLPNGAFAEPGQYNIRVRTLRWFGDKEREEDWKDEVLTPSFWLEYEDDIKTLANQSDEDEHVNSVLLDPCY